MFFRGTKDFAEQARTDGFDEIDFLTLMLYYIMICACTRNGNAKSNKKMLPSWFLKAKQKVYSYVFFRNLIRAGETYPGIPGRLVQVFIFF